MTTRARRSAQVALVKLSVVTLVSVIVTGTLAAIMGNFGHRNANEYTAIFTDASLLPSGADVRVAGIIRGKVTKVEIRDNTKAAVTFKVDRQLTLNDDTRVEIRYLDLVGGRYIALLPGEKDEGSPALRDGATIGTANTKPALNLSALYNGFAPLFDALEPDDVNLLSRNLIQVLQGEGGTIEQLLERTASLTTTIADRDQLVGEVISNLSATLTTVNSRHEQLTDLVTGLRGWLADLASDRVQIGDSVESIAAMAKAVAHLLTEGRPLLKEDIAELRKLAKALASDESKDVMNKVFNLLPELFRNQTRVASYGAWYNYYFCRLKVHINLPDYLDLPALKPLLKEIESFSFHSTAKRCQQ